MRDRMAKNRNVLSKVGQLATRHSTLDIPCCSFGCWLLIINWRNFGLTSSLDTDAGTLVVDTAAAGLICLNDDNVLPASDVVFCLPRRTPSELPLLWGSLPRDDCGNDAAVDWSSQTTASDVWTVATSAIIGRFMPERRPLCMSTAVQGGWVTAPLLDVTGESFRSWAMLLLAVSVESVEDDDNMASISSEMTRRSSAMSLVYNHSSNSYNSDNKQPGPWRPAGISWKKVPKKFSKGRCSGIVQGREIFRRAVNFSLRKRQAEMFGGGHVKWESPRGLFGGDFLGNSQRGKFPEKCLDVVQGKFFWEANSAREIYDRCLNEPSGVSVQISILVSVCSGYDLCHPG